MPPHQAPKTTGFLISSLAGSFVAIFYWLGRAESESSAHFSLGLCSYLFTGVWIISPPNEADKFLLPSNILIRFQTAFISNRNIIVPIIERNLLGRLKTGMHPVDYNFTREVT